MLEEDIQIIQKNTLNFIVVSYYKSDVASSERIITGANSFWVDDRIDTVGLIIMLNQIYERYEMLIMIVKNGFRTCD